jgi:hypothetical protein
MLSEKKWREYVNWISKQRFSMLRLIIFAFVFALVGKENPVNSISSVDFTNIWLNGIEVDGMPVSAVVGIDITVNENGKNVLPCKNKNHPYIKACTDKGSYYKSFWSNNNNLKHGILTMQITGLNITGGIY